MTDYQKAREAAVKALEAEMDHDWGRGAYFAVDAALSAFEADGWVLRPATTISPTTHYSLAALQERQKK